MDSATTLHLESYPIKCRENKFLTGRKWSLDLLTTARARSLPCEFLLSSPVSLGFPQRQLIMTDLTLQTGNSTRGRGETPRPKSAAERSQTLSFCFQSGGTASGSPARDFIRSTDERWGLKHHTHDKGRRQAKRLAGRSAVTAGGEPGQSRWSPGQGRRVPSEAKGTSKQPDSCRLHAKRPRWLPPSWGPGVAWDAH